jgi:hypothetical protein
MDRIWSPGLALIAIFSCGCERSDPLSVKSNSAGTAILTDTAIGVDSRAICITPTRREPCNSRQSEIFVEDVKSFNDVSAKWVDDNLVTVDIVRGTVRRRTDRSRDGRVAIRLNLNTLPPRIRVDYPGGTTSIPRPQP